MPMTFPVCHWGGPPAVLTPTTLSDTFTDANGTLLAAHTMNQGGGWTVHFGGFDIQSNQAAASAFNLGFLAVASAQAGSADRVASVVVTIPAADGWAALAFRVVDGLNYLSAYVSRETGTFSVWQCVAGVYTELSSTAFVPGGTPHTIEVTANGTAVTATVDGGSTRNVVTATHQTATRWGIEAFSVSGASGISFDNFNADLIPSTPPAAPASLIATPASASRISLAWSDVFGETGYDVERSPDGVGSWAVVGMTGAGQLTLSDAGLSASTTYYYRVRARNLVGPGPYSPVAQATTNAAGTQTVLASSDFEYLGAFLVPPGETTLSSGRTLPAYSDNGFFMNLAADEPGFPAPSGSNKEYLDILSGPAAGSYRMISWNPATKVAGMLDPVPVNPGLVAYRVREQFSQDLISGEGWGGLSFRRIGGVLHFTTIGGSAGSGFAALGEHPYEFTAPSGGPVKAASPDALPVGTFVRSWYYALSYGVWYPQQLPPNGNGWQQGLVSPGVFPTGLHWSRDGTRLYMQIGTDYDTVDVPNVSYFEVDAAHAITAYYGPVRFASALFKRTMGNMCLVPQAWADEHLAAGGAEKIAVTGGGYHSQYFTGNSGGPSVLAVDPATAFPRLAYAPPVGAADAGDSHVPRRPVQKDLLAYPPLGLGLCRRPIGVIDFRWLIGYASGPCAAETTANEVQLWFFPAATEIAGVFQYAWIEFTAGPAANAPRQIGLYEQDVVGGEVVNRQLDLRNRCTLGTLSGGPGSYVFTPTPLPVAPNIGDPYVLYHATVVSATATTVRLDAGGGYGGFGIRIVRGAGLDESDYLDGRGPRVLTDLGGGNYSVSYPWTEGGRPVPSAGNRVAVIPYSLDNAEGTVIPADTATYAYWSWVDYCGQAVWIRGAAKQGVLFFPSLTHSWWGYAGARILGREKRHYVYCYDPNDLAQVAAGTQGPSDPIPNIWTPTWDDGSTVYNGYMGTSNTTPHPPTPLSRYEVEIGAGHYAVHGACFDPAENKLYLLVIGEYANAARDWVVHVYSVRADG